jgi:hypothetical protein
MWDTNVHFGENTKENTFRLFFNDYILKNKSNALPISARDMTSSERRYHNEQKETN